MEPTYTPTEDAYEDLKDGTGRVCVARAGVPMPWARAYELGLVKTELPPPRMSDLMQPLTPKKRPF